MENDQQKLEEASERVQAFLRERGSSRELMRKAIRGDRNSMSDFAAQVVRANPGIDLHALSTVCVLILEDEPLQMLITALLEEYRPRR